ncbi:MAG TPA: signal recognition particle-docking protein FtsY [Paenalcaligenes sp.]|nr:signal recognition particle-docking protein FtsY [Paenalcaligenes sp.]
MLRFFRRRKKQDQAEDQPEVAPESPQEQADAVDEPAPADTDDAATIAQDPVEPVETQSQAAPTVPAPAATQAAAKTAEETVAETTEESPTDSEAAAPETPDPQELDPHAAASGATTADVTAQDTTGAHAAEPGVTEPISASAAAEPKQKKNKRSWFSRLRSGLARTGQSLSSIFVGVPVDEDLFEELETALIMADAGMEATDALLTQLRARVRKDRLTEAAQVKEALQEILAAHLTPLEKPFPLNAHRPLVVMIAGVNGAGKTTSIGKLAHAFQAQNASVLLAAGDTFRAAAREQLIEWGERNNVAVIAQDGGDPAAVAYDAVNAAQARDIDVVMVDTAGRLPTQLHLMDELKKIRRVVGKAYEGSPHEVLLVVDGNTGQNALAQIRAFDEAIELTGLIVTKLDGTARGGILAAVASGTQGVRPVPVYWIGVGEGVDDLQPFVAEEFAAALLAGD